MFKKVFGILLLTGLVAVLVFGAINRTQAKSTWSEGNYASNQSRNGRLEYAGGQGNPEIRANGEVLSGQGNRWSQIDRGNRRGQGNQVDQPGAGYSRGNGGGDPAIGNPQAEVDEWLNLEGEVTAVDATLLTITLADGQVIEVSGRPWSYAQENGFSLQVGDRVRLTGFYEDATLEVGAIQNLVTGTSIQIRQENGRPLWAGRGRQG